MPELCLIAVPISPLEQSRGLHFHFVREGITPEPPKKRCKVCKGILQKPNRRLLCPNCGGSGYTKKE